MNLLAPPRARVAVEVVFDLVCPWCFLGSRRLRRMLRNRPDLAVDIGSRRWLRGAATLIGLTTMSLLAWPGFSPVEAAPAMTIVDGVRDEMRSQMIMPLALGADSGRKMGATATVVPLASAPERPRLDVRPLGKAKASVPSASSTRNDPMSRPYIVSMPMVTFARPRSSPLGAPPS